MSLIQSLRQYLPTERRRRAEALKRLAMEQRMQDWGRQVEVEGETISAWRAGRQAPVQIPRWDDGARG